MSKDKFYITTSIAYTNAPPHIGYALELVQADVLARYHKLLGEDVFFLTGTDEHGAKVARRAEESGKTPEEFTDELSDKFRHLTKVLNLSNDDFIRTTDKKRHWPNVEMVWKGLQKKGDIYKKKYKGLYCVGCEAFVKEKDLIDGKCQNHGKEPEVIEEENYFFKLSKPEYVDKLKKEIEENKINIVPGGRKNEILSFIGQGVEDISISRSKENLKWGIPVPGDENQIIYIWFEALINYLFPKDKGYWPPDVHCIGKDIFRFHALIWPIMLIALDLERPKNILVHGFITSGGQKMSKSLGNTIDPFELVKKYGTDAVRYFLLREIPSTEDGDYTEEKFIERHNADLANGIGNTISRVLTMVENKFSGIIPENKLDIVESGDLDIKTGGYIDKKEFDVNEIRDYIQDNILLAWQPCLNNFIFNTCLTAIIGGFKKIDVDINETRPWDLPSDVDKTKSIFYSYLSVIKILAFLLIPFTPETADKIFEQLGLDPKREKEKSFEEATKWGLLQPGAKIKKGNPLFPRI